MLTLEKFHNNQVTKMSPLGKVVMIQRLLLLWRRIIFNRGIQAILGEENRDTALT